MGQVKIEKFGGQLPAWDARFLPEDQASASRDTYLYSGAALGWRKPKLLRSLTNSAAKYAFRIPTITQGIAEATLIFKSNPVQGDQVTIGEITYTFTATVANPYDVLLGSSPTQSQQNLFETINFGSQDITIVGDETPTNPAIASQNPYLGFPFSVTGALHTPGANVIILMPVLVTGTMLLNSISLVAGATNATAKFTAVAYENVNQINSTGTAYTNIPTTLITAGSEVVGCVKDTMLTSSLTVPVTLEAGTVYWLGFILDSAVPLHLASPGLIGVSNANTYTSGPPNPFTTTELSGVTTGGTTVGSLQSVFNVKQPNWQIWGNMSVVSSSDALNTLQDYDFGTGPLPYIEVQAPSFGAAYNYTPVAESTNSIRLKWMNGFVNILGPSAIFLSGGANQSSDTTITGASTWLEFINQDTNVVRTPIVDDNFQRYYFASPGQPPQYNTYDRIAAGKPAFYLGIPAPPIAPELSVSGGGNPIQIGFPGSTTPSTYTIPTSIQAGGNSLLILYPVQSSVAISINDVSIQVLSLPTDNSLLEFAAVVCADTGAINPTNAGQPGEFIGSGDIISLNNFNNTAPFPMAMTSTLGSSLPLNANTQYWIGVIIYEGGTSVIQLSDTKSQGYSVVLPPNNTFGNDSAGIPTAPTMTPNFPDLQLWADVGIGTGGAQEETRAYVYTWVSAYGEEGPPSPPTLLDAYDNATWVVGLQTPLLEDQGVLRNIVKTNIYRTMTSVQGGTVFFFVGSVAASTTTFIDAYTDDVVALNLQLPSTNWFGPPTTLQSIVSMPNGMMAGFRGNEVWFCEPFRPHAWPAEYVMTTDYPIIGLGVSGNTLVAATDTNPNLFIGVNPSTLSQVRLPQPEPCISRGGILSTENGVYYPSVNGLIFITGAGIVSNITQSWITREKWVKFAPQKFIRAVKNVSTYFAFGTTGVSSNGNQDLSVSQQGFTIELSELADRQSFTLWPQVGGHRIGFSILTSPISINLDNVLLDPWSGVVILIAGGGVYYYDFTDQAPQIIPYLWRSKKFQGLHKENFAAFRVWFDTPPGGPQSPPPMRTVLPAKANPSTTAQMVYQPSMLGIIRIIGDGFYVTERELRYSTELLRVVSNTKYTTWQVEIEGVVSVTSIKMATTVKELGTMK